MSWQLMKLEEVTSKIGDGLHGTPKYNKDGEYYFINGNNLRQGRIEIKEDTKKIDFREYQKIKKELNNQTIFVAINGTLGNISMYNGEKIALGKSACYLNVSKNVEKLFIRYTLENGTFQSYAQRFATGATIKNLGLKAVRNYEFLLPPLQTQKRIADILSAYDDLIENNLKRIKLLEQAAQNIYKEWFVNMRFPGHEDAPINQDTGLPEGWGKDILENQIGKVNRKKKLKKDGYLYDGKFPIIDQSNGFIGGYTNNLEVVQTEPLPMVVFGDHTRRVKFINFPFVSGADGTQLLTSINKKMLPAYFYLAIKKIDLSDYKYARHFKYLKQQFIIIPEDEILDLFNLKVSPFLNSCIQLLSYNKKLKTARDILLPRLMNQTIEV